jgi:hypothetical protein
MTRLLTIASVLALLVSAAAAAPVPDGTCCACVEDFVAQTSGPAPPPPETALFCRLLRNQPAKEAFIDRCNALQGTGVCVAMNAAQSQPAEPLLNCAAVLQQEAGIICPAGKAVPAAGQWWLAAMAAALCGIGAWSARRLRTAGATR